MDLKVEMRCNPFLTITIYFLHFEFHSLFFKDGSSILSQNVCVYMGSNNDAVYHSITRRCVRKEGKICLRTFVRGCYFKKFLEMIENKSEIESFAGNEVC